MTTFVRSYRDDNVLVGFFVLIAAVIAIRVQSPTGTVVAAAVALAFVGFGVWLNRQPKRELRISPSEIVLVAKRGVVARIGHADAGGRVAVLKRIANGRAWFSLVAPSVPGSAEIPLEGFRLPNGALAAACASHGWALVP